LVCTADCFVDVILRGCHPVMGFSVEGDGFPTNFQCPLAAKVCVGSGSFFEVKERARGPLSPCQVWWGSDFARLQAGQKHRVFCLSVCPSVTLLNVRVCTRSFTTKALEYRNDFDGVG